MQKPTPEELETMSASELRALALQEEEEAKAAKPAEMAEDKNQAEELDNSEEAEEMEEEPQIFRKEIENEDGSVDVYEATSMDELVNKLAEGKRQAVAQMKRVQEEKRELERKAVQENTDLDYVVGEELKKNPRKAIQEVARQTIADERAKYERSQAVQSNFVNSHHDYLPTQDNANRLMAEFRRLYPSSDEFTMTGLEKAYQALKTNGLLVLRSEEANEPAKADGKEAQATSEAKPETTQARSPKRSSNLQMRPKTAPADKGFDEDEAYKLPMEELVRRANAQLAAQSAE